MSLILSGTDGVTASGGLYSQTPFTGTYTDGSVLDYVTGTGRITVGAADGFKIRNGGISAPVDLVSVDSAGNVGVGVTPSAWYSASGFKALQVGLYGFTSVADGGSAYTSRLMNNSYYNSGGSPAFTGSNYASEYRQTAGVHSWHTSTASGTAGNAISFTQAMTLDASGNLLVGRTSSLNSASRLQLDNSGNSAPIAWLYNSNSVDFTASLVRAEVNKAAATTFEFYSAYNNVAKCFTVYGNGNVQNTNNSYGALSDSKLKENIVDATPKLEKLNQVRIVNYNLIGDDQKQIGVIAQELEQIFPSMVDEAPDKDEEGNDLGTTTKSVKYSVFVPMLIKAMQEQQALITQLQADVATLKEAK